MMEIIDQDVLSKDVCLEKDDMFERIGTEGLSNEDIGQKSITYWADVWRRFRSNKMAILGLVLLTGIVLLLFIGPSLKGLDYQKIDAAKKNLGPSSEHWFGTDDMGRDLFTRVCVGGRISIYIGLSCTFVMFIIGSLLGALAGLKGGIVDDIIMRICELIGNLPYLIIVVILSMVMGRSMFSLVFAMSITAWVGTTRMVRGQILQIKEQDYVQAAEALGASTYRIIIKHLLPNTLGIIMVSVTMSIPGFIFSEAFLSYIGLGVRPPETSWGALASAGQLQLMFYPYQLFFPCLLIILTMLSFHLIGDGLSDALDPKLRK
ncbi:ABC transporter permease [Paeniclostridium sordellii]|nr:ABC transporter permease [Paeniclostridium sordellii]MCR1848464.1 ABC transporter permease [Paeniclostridium sordellii]